MISNRARSACWFGFASMLVGAAAGQAAAQEVTIEWEIANRFRLFAEQIDFDIQVRAFRAVGGKTVLETERKLAHQSARGIGWAAGVHRLCFDSWTGQVPPRCRRDGVEESYLSPRDLRIRLGIKLPADFGNAKCTWTIGTGDTAKTVPDRDCSTIVNDQRFPPNKATAVSVMARSDTGASVQAGTTIEPRDVLIVGLGDSTASGEGNPTKPVALNDNGFCFRRVLLRDRNRFFLPGRARANVVADCPLPGENRDQRDEWEAANAEWQFAPCHLSLYSYQARAALKLAIENPALSVTYYPLGCTGATIRQGLLAPQSARERPKRGNQIFPRTVRSQIDQLTAYLGGPGNNLARRPDLIFLTVGGNDLKFSGLVADLLIANDPERRILRDRGLISTVADSRQALGPVAEDFKALRRALLRLMGANLEKVVFVNYGNPAMYEGDKLCPGSRRGVDAHPAFAINGSKLEAAVNFVENEMLPQLKSLATCGENGGCGDPGHERMTYVDEHRSAFRQHGLCAADATDPRFDRECFRDGDSFNNAAQGGLNDPLKCGPAPSNFRPYAKRARWIRTVNDSFFTAMTYPAMGDLANPADIHDGLWGVASVVYGGAIHPTGEGHAAMADAAMPAARRLLGLPPPTLAANATERLDAGDRTDNDGEETDGVKQ